MEEPSSLARQGQVLCQRPVCRICVASFLPLDRSMSKQRGPAFSWMQKREPRVLKKRKWNGECGQVLLQNSILYIECQPALSQGCLPKWRYKFLFLRVQRSHSLPLQFLATDHWPLSTALSKSGPAVPCKSFRNVLYCKVEPAHIQAGPERAASHTCPPTMPRPPTISTSAELNVRNLPPATIAPGTAATNPKCPHLPSAAPPMYCGTNSPMQPLPSLPAPGSVSCHEEHAAVTVLRTFCTKTTSFAHFQSKTDRELTATASCYESPCRYPVTRREKKFSKLGPSGQNKHFDTLSIPCRYPISVKLAVRSRHIWSRLGHFWTEPAPSLHTCAPLPTRRRTPPLTPTLYSTRADAVTRNDVVNSPIGRVPPSLPSSNPRPEPVFSNG